MPGLYLPVGVTLGEHSTKEVFTVTWVKGGFMEDNTASNTDLLATPDSTQEMLSKDKVNKIVTARMAEAAEKARREAEAEYMQRLEKMKAESSNSMGGMPSFDPNAFKQEVLNDVLELARKQDQESALAQQQAEAQKFVKEYEAKIASGTGMYPDYEDVMKKFNPGAFPMVAYLANGMENTAQIMYELAKNPNKLATIDFLAQKDADLAQEQLRSLSNSISQNERAKAEHVPVDAPLSRLKSSTAGGADAGELSLKDLKRASWLKG